MARKAAKFGLDAEMLASLIERLYKEEWGQSQNVILVSLGKRLEVSQLWREEAA